MIIRIFLVLLLAVCIHVYGQTTYAIDQSIEVTDNSGRKLTVPWGGGLNASQFNTMDLDHDKQEDLVIFDRMANKVVTYLLKDGQYVYHPEYENLFPADVTNWLLLRDYNCDGKKDIFTGDVLGMKVYTNTSADNGLPTWKQIFFYAGSGSTTKSPVLLTKGFTSKINLQLQYDDLPSVTDVDGDGDLDIFNIRYAANGTIEYHKNFSKERYGSCDSLDFERVTQAWGGIRECTCGVFAFHDADCPPIGGRTQHAGGKSLTVLDINGDGQKDVVFAEASCDKLFQFINEGTLAAPVINSAAQFPPSHPTQFQIFPAAFLEDVDQDGKKDLITSPNIFSKTSLQSNLNHSNWFYKNTGTDEKPVFNFVQDNFLQEDMIDVGDNAVPAFVDYDGDGDQDMFISCHASPNFNSAIALYENTGSPQQPAFKLIEPDYLGFSLSGFYNMKIQFVDINRDATKDLVFTATGLNSGITDIYYIPNKRKDALDFSGQAIQTIDFTLTSTENVCVTDVNNDGKPDLLVGRSNGALEYWRNSDSGPAVSFAFENASFLGLASSVLRQNISCATADLDGDGKTDLVLGDQTGFLKIISDYQHASDASGEESDIVFNPLLDNYGLQNLGGRLWPVPVNLFNTTRPAIVVGNTLGGIYVLRNDGGESLPDIPVVDLYPNPVDHNKELKIQTDRAGVIQVFSILGQKMGDPISVQAYEISSYKVNMLAPGMYVAKFSVGSKSYSRRIVIY